MKLTAHAANLLKELADSMTSLHLTVPVVPFTFQALAMAAMKLSSGAGAVALALLIVFGCPAVSIGGESEYGRSPLASVITREEAGSGLETPEPVIDQRGAEKLIDLAVRKNEQGKFGDIDQFLADLAEAMNSRDRDRGFILLSRCQFSLGLFDESLESLRNVAPASPLGITALFNVADIQSETGDFSARAETMKEILRVAPDNSEARAELAILEEMAGEGGDLADGSMFDDFESTGPATSFARGESGPFVSSWWSNSTERPGFPFLTGNQPGYGITTAGLNGSVPVSKGIRILGGWNGSKFSESDKDDLRAERFDLGLIADLPSKGEASLAIGHTRLDNGLSGNSLSAAMFQKFGNLKARARAFREYNAVDSGSYANPYTTAGVSLTLDLQLSEGFSIEAAPRHTTVSWDDNSMTGFRLKGVYRLLSPRPLAYSLEYDTYGFSREKREDGTSFSYFAPNSCETVSFGMNWELVSSSRFILDISGKFENSSYENLGANYTYRRIFAGTGMKIEVSKGTILSADYSMSLSITDGFQTVHDFSAGLSRKY